MPRVVPGQVFRFITTIPLREGPNGLVSMNSVRSTFLCSLLELSDQIPDELLAMDDEAYASLVTGRVAGWSGKLRA
jgi:hypothetical protein